MPSAGESFRGLAVSIRLVLDISFSYYASSPPSSERNVRKNKIGIAENPSIVVTRHWRDEIKFRVTNTEELLLGEECFLQVCHPMKEVSLRLYNGRIPERQRTSLALFLGTQKYARAIKFIYCYDM